MPTIAIDASSAEKTQRTGVEEYSFQIIERIKERAIMGDNRLVLYSHKTLPWLFKRFWLQARVTWELFRRPPDVFFVPGQALPFFIFKKIKVFTTIHDLGFIRRPDLYPSVEVRRQKAATKRAAKRADIIFVPSEFTKKELMEIYRVKPEKIVVTPEAADTTRFKVMSREAVEAVINKYRLGYKNYFLFIGRVEAKKNPTVLISAFTELKKRMGFGDPLRLVFAGSPGYRFQEVKKMVDGSLYKDFFVSLGYTSAEDLPALINGALALLVPSWYEGFGLTLLEGAACGTPVAASDIPAHREVMNEAVYFVPPQEPEHWVTALNNLVREPKDIYEFSAKGQAQVKLFSWDKTADQTWQSLTNYGKLEK